jgi:ABC-type dipeptide/oligopeptide/nickel transport system permease component
MFDETLVIDPQIVARLREHYGLNRPFWVQFADYVGALVQGDWGTSLRNGQPVWDTFKSSIPISAQLGLAATVVLVAVGIPLGVLAAKKQNTWIDYWIVAVSIGVRSIPVFVLAPMLLILLVLKLGIMKTPIGFDGIFSQKAILPVLLMAAGPLLVVVRQTRAGVVEVMSQTYVRTARGKGLPERRVVTRHILKNALTPVMTSMGLILSSLITGALFVELIFAIPGFAGLGINAFQTRDYPFILGTTIVGAMIIIVANLLVDLAYGILDPRVRYR